MKPARFDYHGPSTLDEALALLAAHQDDAKVLAGGQSLVPMLALRLARFEHLVDLQRVAPLQTIDVDDDLVRIGAMTTQATIGASPEVAEHASLLHRATPLIGHHQIRNRGTLGGSVCHADPASEYPAVLVALEAELDIESAAGTRREQAAAFFEGTWSTTIAADEVLTGVRLPRWPGRRGCAIDEVARRHGDFALVGAAAAVAFDDGDRLTRVGLGLFGVASTPHRDPEVQQLVGRGRGEISTADLEEIGRAVAAGIDPPTDVHASGHYRRRVAAQLVPRVLAQAIEEAGRG
jgi:aerobic carbon-monoxide dehydrogenase medium subunit